MVDSSPAFTAIKHRNLTVRLPITTLRPAIEADAIDLAPRLRDEDRAEINALTGQTPEQALLLGPQRSASVVCINERPEMMFYCEALPTAPGAGFFGMISSAEIFRDELLLRVLLRGSRELVRAWHERFSTLATITAEDNLFHQRWLRFLGFDFIDKREHEGRAYYTAARRRGTRTGHIGGRDE